MSAPGPPVTKTNPEFKVLGLSAHSPKAISYPLAQRTRDNTQGAQDEAAKYLKQPYERQHSDLAER